MTTLGWYPPAPMEGPLAMLDLPPDDWAIEPKMNGCRVIIAGGEVWTRQGTPLTKGKGREALLPLANVCMGTLEGEWIPGVQELWLFDMPDRDVEYAERRYALERFWEMNAKRWKIALRLVPSRTLTFADAYESWKGEPYVEGVVMKRRASRYTKCHRPNTVISDWIKRRFSWDRRKRQ
jgi:ATP-dependent DNA ligase